MGHLSVFLLSASGYCPMELFLVPRLNSLLNNKCFEWAKFKTFPDDNFKVTKMTIVVFDRVENVIGKGENACYQYFLLFPQCLHRAFSRSSLKVGIVW